jgi:hypothetical protein
MDRIENILGILYDKIEYMVFEIIKETLTQDNNLSYLNGIKIYLFITELPVLFSNY